AGPLRPAGAAPAAAGGLRVRRRRALVVARPVRLGLRAGLALPRALRDGRRAPRRLGSAGADPPAGRHRAVHAAHPSVSGPVPAHRHDPVLVAAGDRLTAEGRRGDARPAWRLTRSPRRTDALGYAR